MLVANSLPALNDVTAMELPEIVAEAAKVCLLTCSRALGNYFLMMESLYPHHNYRHS